MCVSSDMSKNIRVIRLEKSFVLFLIFYEVMPKLFFQLILLLLHPNNNSNSTNRWQVWIMGYFMLFVSSLSKR